MNTINDFNIVKSQSRPAFQRKMPRLSLNQSIISGMLGQNSNDILELTKFVSKKRLSFLDSLSHRYNRENFYKNQSQKEDSNIVNEIFNLVKNPKAAHRYLTSQYEGSIRLLKRIFVASSGSRSRINFAKKIHQEIVQNDYKASETLIPELLESENSKEYIRNYPKYKSYLILNREDSMVVQNLDNMLEAGSFDSKYYDRKLKYQRLKDKYSLSEAENFNSEIFAANYTKSRANFLESLIRHNYISPEMMENGVDKDIYEMFMSINDNNLVDRKNVMKRFLPPVVYTQHDETQSHSYISNLNKLFKRMDSDKHIDNFVSRMSQHYFCRVNLEVLNYILDSIPAAKLDIFSDNVIRISRVVDKEDLIDVLEREMENPFYETDAARKNREAQDVKVRDRVQDAISKVKRYIINKVNILRYNRIKQDSEANFASERSRAEVLPNSAASSVENGIRAEVQAQAEVPTQVQAQAEAQRVAPAQVQIQPEVQAAVQAPIQTQAEAQAAVQAPIQTQVEAQPAVPVQVQTQAEELAEVLPIAEENLVSETIPAVEEEVTAPVVSAKSKRQAAKEEVAQSIFEVIGKKLGTKTLSTQRDAFAQNATKMRLSMLPEIFASVADTRKADRTVGKYRINSSNKDVLDLYLLINGNNKKFINYLLKKRNVDNTRMFELKEIIEMVRKAEARIQADKKANPEYRARDARRYYNHLYESKIQQYGKVQRQSKVNTKA